jgi:hypothetical protein
MFENFQLYDTLYDTYKNETTFDAMDQFVLLMRQMDTLGLQIIGVLIQKHSQNKDSIPYEGKDVGSNQAKFDMRNFDPVLKHILFDFAKKHLLKRSQPKVEVLN